MVLYTDLGFRAATYGLTLWAVGVGLIRTVPDLVPSEENPARQMALLALTVPISIVTIKSLPMIGIPIEKRLEAMAVASAAAVSWHGGVAFSHRGTQG